MPASDRFGYPFALVLPPDGIEAAMKAHGVSYRERLFDPVTTLYAWMGQIISQDRSCRHAVSRVVAYHAANGRAVSARTGAYVQARQRLNLPVIQHLSRGLARGLEEQCKEHRLIGRPVFAVDGSVLSAPDTESNQVRFPQHGGMEEGLGFPLIRLVLIVSLATGAIIDLAVAPHKGEGSSEHATYRRSHKRLLPGDVIVGDRLYYSYFGFHDLSKRGVDSVCRKSDFPKLRGRPLLKVLGRDDRVYEVPKTVQPRWMSNRLYSRVPRTIPLRATGCWIDTGDRSTKRLELVSTFTDGSVRADELSELYRLRWNIELDIRSLKIDLGADVLRCKTARMLVKELWVTALAYNAVRALTARAAASIGVTPRSLSARGAMQVADAFGPRLDTATGPGRDAVVSQMLAAMASHVVGNRPDRVEPRLVKRRRKRIDLMTIPRDEARAFCRGGRYDR